MNRFFRTAYSTTLVCLCLTLFTVLITKVRMPFLAFSCLYFGLLISLLPAITQRLTGKDRLFYVIGAIAAMLGFLPLALRNCPAAHWVVHFLGIAAAASFLYLLRYRTTHSDFLAKYQFAAILLLILIGLVYLAMLTGIYTDGETSARSETLRLAMNNIVPYAIMLLVTGVLLLRGLRAQEGIVDEQAFNRRQLRDTLIFAVIVTLVFAVDPFVYLQKAVLFLFNDVLRPAGNFIVQLLAWLLKQISVPKQPVQNTVPPEEHSEWNPVPIVEPGETEKEHYYIEDYDLTRIIAYIFVAAAVLILLWILVRQIRKLIFNLRARSQKREGGYPSEIREALSPEEGTRRADRPKKRSSDPRERIRYLYGDFLRYLKKLRVKFDKTNTCGEIRLGAEIYSKDDPSALADLTVLYEQARYRLKEAPTEADARVMKDLLDRIKKKS